MVVVERGDDVFFVYNSTRVPKVIPASRIPTGISVNRLICYCIISYIGSNSLDTIWMD
jgi:hypothetical protein